MKNMNDIIKQFKVETGYTLSVRDGKFYYKGDMNLSRTAVTCMPDSLVVCGSLSLNHTKITSLPDSLVVAGSLSLCNTEFTSLPDDLVVGGTLFLNYTEITSLPDNMVACGLSIGPCTGITSLPPNLTVGDVIYLNAPEITSLPPNLTVGSYLYLEDMKITSQPENLKAKHVDPACAGGLPYIMYESPPSVLRWRNGKYLKADNVLYEVIYRKGNVHKVKYIARDAASYMVTDGEGHHAHGRTLKEATAYLPYTITERYTSACCDLSRHSLLTLSEAIKAYRTITGACPDGVRHYVENELPVRKCLYTISEIIRLTEGCYGNEIFKAFFHKRP